MDVLIKISPFRGSSWPKPFDILHHFMHEVASFSTHAIKVSVQFVHNTSSVCKRLHVNHLSIIGEPPGGRKKLHKFNLSSRMWEWIDSVPLQGLFSAFKCQKIGIFRLQSREQWQQITVWRIIKSTIETKVIKDMRKVHERLLEFNSFSSFELCQKIKRVQRSFSTMICLFSKANSLSFPLHRLLPTLLGITRPKLCFFDEVSTPLALYSFKKAHS